MSGEKPAPTAAEIKAARRALPGAIKYLVSMGWDGYEKLAVLLAALDAAEARADTAEKSLDIVRARWVEADRRANDNAERAENMRAEWVPWTKKLATAERERDDALAALGHAEERLRDALDRGNKWEAACHEAEVRVAELAAKLDGAIVVSDTEETRERIAEAINEARWQGKINKCPDGRTDSLWDITLAVLATLREAPRG